MDKTEKGLQQERLTKLVYKTITMLEKEELSSLLITGKRADGSYFFMCTDVENPYEMHGFLSIRGMDLMFDLEDGMDDIEDGDVDTLLEGL